MNASFKTVSNPVLKSVTLELTPVEAALLMRLLGGTNVCQKREVIFSPVDNNTDHDNFKTLGIVINSNDVVLLNQMYFDLSKTFTKAATN